MKTIEIDIKSNNFDRKTIQIVKHLFKKYNTDNTNVIISLIIDRNII